MEEATKYPTGTSPETTESINEVKLSDSPDTITADILFAIKDNDPEIETLVGRLISINSNDDEIDTFTKNVIIEAVKKHIKLIIKYESDNENWKRNIERDFEYIRRCIPGLLKAHKIAREYGYKLGMIDSRFDHIVFLPLDHSCKWWYWLEGYQDIMPNVGQEKERLEEWLEERFRPQLSSYITKYYDRTWK